MINMKKLLFILGMYLLSTTSAFASGKLSVNGGNMKSLLLIALLILSGCGTETYVTKVVKESVHFNLDSFPEVKAYLIEAVDACGKGVIDPEKKEENKCQFHIDVNEDLFERFKTGLLHDKDKETDGKQYMMPSEEDVKALPEAWDIRSLNPAVSQVKINRQTCGSCWAESSQKLLDLQVAVNDGKVIDSSVQYMVSTCVPTGDCNGGYMTTPDHIIKNKFGGGGLPFWVDDPYLGTNSTCKWSKEQMAKGWDYKLKSAPYVGTSLMHSKGAKEGSYGNTAEMIKALMFKHKSGALVTVNAYDVSGNGIVSNCSFGGTNHMVVVTGWGKENGTEFASVWNSWGKGHGLNGISRIKWECGGPGKLNRRLGEEARVYIYEPKCANQPEAFTGPSKQIIKTDPSVGTLIGKKATNGQKCKWTPEAGLSDPNSCETFASPEISTEYHLKASTECGEASAMVTVSVLGPKLEKDNHLRTPFGVITE